MCLHAIDAHARDNRSAFSLISRCINAESFEQRMTKLNNYIHGRPETVIALTTHHAVMKALAGRSFKNAEWHTITI